MVNCFVHVIMYSYYGFAAFGPQSSTFPLVEKVLDHTATDPVLDRSRSGTQRHPHWLPVHSMDAVCVRLLRVFVFDSFRKVLQTRVH